MNLRYLFNSTVTTAVISSGIALSSTYATISFSDIQFGGFVSQGFFINDGENDYFGESSEGTFDFREYAANASYATGSFRCGAQGFGQKLGKYGDDKILLDWATIDWQPQQWFGVRAGRVKMSRGLYNEALDVDAVRPFILLPQSVYDNRLRDFNASFDGAMIYGNFGIGNLGSVDYRAFYGDKPIELESGATDYFNNNFLAETRSFEMDSARGGTVFWNTPVMGLPVGYSYSAFINLSSNRLVFGSFDYDKTASSYDRHLVSAEYAVGDWMFAAEAGEESAYYDIDLCRVGSTVTSPFEVEFLARYYMSAAWRTNDWLELGAYMSYSRDAQDYADPAQAGTFPVLRQTDWAVSAKFALTEKIVAKIEGH